MWDYLADVVFTRTLWHCVAKHLNIRDYWEYKMFGLVVRCYSLLPLAILYYSLNFLEMEIVKCKDDSTKKYDALLFMSCASGLCYLMSQNIDPIVSFVCQTATHAIEVRIDGCQQVLCKQTHCYIYS